MNTRSLAGKNILLIFFFAIAGIAGKIFVYPISGNITAISVANTSLERA